VSVAANDNNIVTTQNGITGGSFIISTEGNTQTPQNDGNLDQLSP
jgi:L-lactate utilization protein LutB